MYINIPDTKYTREIACAIGYNGGFYFGIVIMQSDPPLNSIGSTIVHAWFNKYAIKVIQHNSYGAAL